MIKSTFTIALAQSLVAAQETGLECGDKIVKYGAREVEFSRIELELEHAIETCWIAPLGFTCYTTEALLDQICSMHHYSFETNTIDGTGEWCQDRYRPLREFDDLDYFFDPELKAELMDEACAVEKAAVMEEYNRQIDQRTYLLVLWRPEYLAFFKQFFECTDCINNSDPTVDNNIRGRELWWDSEGNNMGPPSQA